MTIARPFPDDMTERERDRLLTRMMTKVTVSESGCWVWTGTRTSLGYGRVSFRRQAWQAHRMLYQLLVGPVAIDLHLDHLCRNRICVNPAHLEPVTPRINLLRGLTLTAMEAAVTHCPNGHPYDEANTHLRPCGRRRCRLCDRDRQRRKAERTGPVWRKSDDGSEYRPSWLDEAS